jgi:hypothetical protein
VLIGSNHSSNTLRLRIPGSQRPTSHLS